MPRHHTPFKLNKEQQKLIEDNVKFVFYFARKVVNDKRFIYKNEEDEILSYFFEKACYAARTYDKRKGRFITYLAKALKSGLFRYLQLKDRYNQRFVSISFRTKNNNIIDIEDTTKKDVNKQYFYELLKESKLKKEDFLLIHDYYFMKKTHKEMAEDRGLSGQRISQLTNEIIKKIRKKAEQEQYMLKDFYSYET